MPDSLCNACTLREHARCWGHIGPMSTPADMLTMCECREPNCGHPLVRAERMGRAIEADLAKHPGYAPAPRERKSFEQSGGIGEGSDA